MRKNNVWHITWIVSMYAVLITILYLVVVYKVKWENRDLNDYLYFYDCGSTFCTTTNKVDNYYSTVRCTNHSCPTIIYSKNRVVILRDSGKEYLYDYVAGQVINDNYQKYAFTSQDNYYIVSDTDNHYGVIDLNGNIIVPLNYSLIKDYNGNLVVYQTDELLGIASSNDENINIIPSYNDVILIDDYIFAAKKDENYEIYSLSSNEKVSNDSYNYLYPYNGAILAIKNGQLDILGYDLKSKIIMKINTYYPYTDAVEQSTLNIKTDGNTLRFTIYTSDKDYTNYLFDIKNAKLYT